ncbi:MAG: hypothetical protein LBJ44_00545 [Propionibacteriaceae bacterium]|jgi:hypothetical protein|nr:hypothetical protein [Propionibacteriaceae bacterium]
MTNSKIARAAAAGLGALLLCGVGAMAWADDGTHLDDQDQNVALLLNIESLGALTLSVAEDEVELTEGVSLDPTQRVFTGTLHNVTVTDTRDPAAIDDDVYWYVVGQVTDFSAVGLPDIPALNLGWAPFLDSDVDPDEVAAGPGVTPYLDDPTGGFGTVGGKEMFAYTDNSNGVAPGSWTGSADLTLKTGVAVAAGDYEATLTLSLFE